MNFDETLDKSIKNYIDKKISIVYFFELLSRIETFLFINTLERHNEVMYTILNVANNIVSKKDINTFLYLMYADEIVEKLITNNKDSKIFIEMYDKINKKYGLEKLQKKINNPLNIHNFLNVYFMIHGYEKLKKDFEGFEINQICLYGIQEPQMIKYLVNNSSYKNSLIFMPTYSYFLENKYLLKSSNLVKTNVIIKEFEKKGEDFLSIILTKNNNYNLENNLYFNSDFKNIKKEEIDKYIKYIVEKKENFYKDFMVKRNKKTLDSVMLDSLLMYTVEHRIENFKDVYSFIMNDSLFNDKLKNIAQTYWMLIEKENIINGLLLSSESSKKPNKRL